MSSDLLESNRRDHTVAILRAVSSGIPVVGGTIAEAISAVIPGQRLDRIVDYLRILRERLDALERKVNVENPFTVDLLEDTVLQAGRSLSEQRNQYLAYVMTDSADVSPIQYEFNKKLLQILAELTDRDIEVLTAHTDFEALHRLKQRLPPPDPLTKGERRSLSPEAKFERESRKVSLDVHIAALERHGLLVPKRETPHSSAHIVEHGGPLPSEIAHLDRNTGLPKITSYKVTTLGRLLLTRILGTYFD